MNDEYEQQGYSSLPDDRQDDFRAPPHNIEAEQALLGAILINNQAYDGVADFLTEDHFFESLHGRIYAACAEMIKAGRMATGVTLKEFFDRDPALADFDGAAYLARLASAATTIINSQDYARIIVDLAVRRGLIDIAQRLEGVAFDAPINITPQEIAETAESELAELVTRGASNNDMRAISGVVDVTIETAGDAYQHGTPIGLSTGLPSCDELIGPMTPGAVIVLGGATSMGKSALADQIGDHNAEQGKVVGKFCLEMLAEESAARSIAKIARVPAWRIESGHFNEDEFSRIWDARKHFAAMPLYIEDKRGLKVSQIRSRALRLKRRKGLDLVIIDHLQFIRPEKDSGQQSAMLEQITRDVKAMAGDLRCPVILVSHVSRETQKRDDNRPRISDLHGSSGIEKDADVVLFVHRPEYYLERAMPEENTTDWLKWEDAMAKWRGMAELILAKRRKGKGSGSRRVVFNGEYTHFSEVDDMALEPLTQQQIEAQEAFAL